MTCKASIEEQSYSIKNVVTGLLSEIQLRIKHV